MIWAAPWAVLGDRGGCTIPCVHMRPLTSPIPSKQHRQLTPQETDHALATAVLMHLMKLDAASTIEGQLKSGDGAGGPGLDDTLFVHIQGKGKGKDGTRVFEVSVDEASTGAATVVKVKGPDGGEGDAARVVTIKDIDWELGEPIFRASFDGALRTLQCLGTDTLGCVGCFHVHFVVVCLLI